jgi:C1A family cysteine protease
MLAMERGPVIADMWIDPSFLSLKRASIYTYEASPVAVLHTVVLVGYDAAKETWLIQNSLGEGWCDGGFGLISFGSGGLLGGTAGGRWGWEIRVK